MTVKNQKTNRHCGFKRTGSVLALAMLMVMVSLMIGTGLLMLGTQVRTQAARHIQRMMARSAADAGIEAALGQINNAVEKGSWTAAVCPTISQTSLFNTDSTYAVQTNYNVSDGYTVRSTGTNGDRVHQVTATLRLKGLFDMAIQCRRSIVLKNGVSVQTVDSTVSLDPDDTDKTAVIGTNSTESASIVLNRNVTIDGDVVVGVGGDVSDVIKDLGASTQAQYALTASLDFPAVEVPDISLPGTSIQVAKGEKTIGTGGDYSAVGRFSGLTLKNGATLRVVDDCILYITGDVEMGQSSQIVVDSASGASLTIYLEGDWVSDNSASVTNETESTSAFQLYAVGNETQTIDLRARNDFFGTIYAPNADVTVYADGDVYGAVVADNFELKSSGTFYYDAALQNVSIHDVGVCFVVNRWNEQ